MTAVDPAVLRAHIEILRWARSEKAKLAEIEASAKAAVQDAMGENDSLELDGRRVATWKTSKRRVIDQKLLERLHPDVAAECTAVTEVRTFRLVDE